MVRRRRSYDRYGKVDGEVTYSRYNAAGFAAAMPSPLPGVAIDPCHDRDSIPPFRSGASKDMYRVWGLKTPVTWEKREWIGDKQINRAEPKGACDITWCC